MNMQNRNPKNKILLTAIAVITVLGTYEGQVNSQAAIISTSSAVTTTQTVPIVPSVGISPDIWTFDTKHTDTDFFVQNGTTYLSYEHASEIFRDLVWSYDQKSDPKCLITLASPLLERINM
ncbi:hypothetical protein ACP8HI_07285 [Paenibacillus sp. FA6]|uniref:hypothetical protein n=1 Tax=Paenibacillus sp. FA6 TaxID=3413029 RepID=UPI003F65DF6C